MKKIDTLEMAARDISLKTLIGKRAAAESSYNGRIEGVITAIEYNTYPVITMEDGRTFRAGSVVELI